MPLAVTVTSFSYDSDTVSLRGTIVPSGTYPTGGDTVNFVGATYPQGQGPVATSGAPLRCEFYSTKYAAALFIYQWIRGTNQTNQLMGVFTGAAAQSGLAEFSTAAYSAAMLADTIEFEAKFARL